MQKKYNSFTVLCIKVLLPILEKTLKYNFNGYLTMNNLGNVTWFERIPDMYTHGDGSTIWYTHDEMSKVTHMGNYADKLDESYLNDAQYAYEDIHQLYKLIEIAQFLIEEGEFNVV